MGKTLVVSSRGDAEWKSCQSILSGLIETYKNTSGDIDFIKISKDENVGSSIADVKAINFENVARVVFVDYKPHPFYFLKCLFSLKKISHQVEFIFHVYGDFILFSSLWVKAFELVANNSIKVVAASQGQKRLLAKLVSEEHLFVCPFSINSKKFHFSQASSDDAKRKLGVEGRDVWVYTGRLSIQKNVLELISVFKHYHQQINSNAILLIAGEFDDLGKPYIGSRSSPNTMSNLLSKKMESDQNIVRYLGVLDQDDLANVYLASEYYVSLSTHNDEDFGMSPLEALASGCKLVLTQWGGYRDYISHFPQICRPVPVKLNDSNGPTLQLEKAVAAMIHVSSTIENRNDISNMANLNYSPEKNFENISQILMKHVSNGIEIKELFYKISSRLSANSLSPFSDGRGGYSRTYVELYGDY